MSEIPEMGPSEIRHAMEGTLRATFYSLLASPIGAEALQDMVQAVVAHVENVYGKPAEIVGLQFGDDGRVYAKTDKEGEKLLELQLGPAPRFEVISDRYVDNAA